MIRDRGFGFTAKNQVETVTVKVELHWDRKVSLDELKSVLAEAYAEAYHRAVEAMK